MDKTIARKVPRKAISIVSSIAEINSFRLLKSGGNILESMSPKYFEESDTNFIKSISMSLITNIKIEQNKTIEIRVFHDH